MKKLILAASAATILTGAANAALLVHYTFDGNDATNDGTLGDGAVVGGSTFVTSTAGTAAGNAWQGNRSGLNDAYVQTGVDGTSLGMGAGGVYTAMAWISWAGTFAGGSVDHMVFGQEDGAGNNAQLHHGIRDDSAPANIHFGGWGADQDSSDAGAVPNDGTWTHVAWQYDGTDKVVYVNGVETSRAVGNNISSPALNVIIGGHGRDAADPAGQSFNGLLDDVRIYDEVLDAAGIAAAADQINIPEPGTFSLIGLAGLGMVLRRRRR